MHVINLKMSFLLPNLDLDDHRRPPNTLMIYCSENYAKTITLVHQKLRRCIQIISGTSPSDVSSTACRRTCRRAASKPVLTPHMRNRCFQFALRYLHGSVDDRKRSCHLMNLPFSACPATNKGHLDAKIDP